MSRLVRPLTPDDMAAVADIYAPYVQHTWATFEEVPPTADELAARITPSPHHPWLVVERDGLVTGFAYAMQHRTRPAYRWTVEVSVYLQDSERGRGSGRALYLPLLQHLRDLGYALALAAIALPNPASVALHKALSFTQVGQMPGVGFKGGAWRDVGWWALPLVEHLEVDQALPEPRAWTAHV